tara:strand:+ start:1222 stop:1422 length:201 start_codon:yes stop_codon:yes gene_type:complete
LTIPWDHALGVEDNHTAAAEVFALKWGWLGTWAGGAMPKGDGYTFVCVTSAWCPDFEIETSGTIAG